MKERPFKHKAKSAVNARIVLVQDIITICPKCGGELALWTKEAETVCLFCEHKVFEKEGTVH